MSIEEIKELVQIEKEAREKLRKANEEAANLIEKAEEDARKILQEAEDQNYYDNIFKAKIKEIEEKKESMEKAVEEKAERLREIANKNLEKTVAFIVKLALGG